MLGGAVIWVGAILGSLLAFRVLDRLGRIRSVIWALVGFVAVYVPMATVAANTVALVPLYCLLGVVTWFGASACWPLPSELLPTAVRGRAQGVGSGLQRVSIGVNVLIVPHLRRESAFARRCCSRPGYRSHSSRMRCGGDGTSRPENRSS